jgi:hypothetical protein
MTNTIPVPGTASLISVFPCNKPITPIVLDSHSFLLLRHPAACGFTVKRNCYNTLANLLLNSYIESIHNSDGPAREHPDASAP